jgi:predicted RNase H-like HicB family nuclease
LDPGVPLDEPFTVYLESNRLGRTMAHVAQLPGCIVRAQTADRAIDLVETAIAQHLDWLGHHSGVSLPAPVSFTSRIAGQYDGGAASGSGSRVALLPPDRWPLDDAELQRYLRRMAYSRHDLLEMTSLPRDVLAAPGPGGQRPIREILQHVAAAEQWYLTRLFQVARFPAQRTVLLRLHVVREAADRLLAASDLTLSDQVVENGGEAWTLRKVLRRFLEHEREHMLEIEQRLYQIGQPIFPAWMSAQAISRELRLAGEAQG